MKKWWISLSIVLLALIVINLKLGSSLKKKSCDLSHYQALYFKTYDSLKVLKDSIVRLQDSLNNLSGFSLSNNAEALDYLDEYYGENLHWNEQIRNKILETNNGQGDNTLIPFNGMYGPMKINSVKILNHKWLITDFTDGKVWGEMLVEYEPVKNHPDSIRFKTFKSVLYPFNP